MNKLFCYLFFLCCTGFFISCEKEASREIGSALEADGSLVNDTAGVCMPDSVHGTFYNGITPGSDTAYVEVQVNVSSTGSYKIESDLQDGFLFSDSGFFSTTGINTIRLKPIGTPIIPGDFTFSINFDSSLCNFSVTINDSTGTGLGGNQNPNQDLGDWHFTTDSGGDFHGDFAYVQFFYDSTATKKYELGLSGFTPTGDTSLVLVIFFPGNQIVTGTYQTQPPANSNEANAYMGFANINSGETIYSALAGYPPNINLSITIASYDAVTRIVKGTFSGTALIEKYYDQGTPVGIQNGTFTATVSP